MMRISLLISISLLLTACTQSDYQAIEIIGINQSQQTVVRGMGVRLRDESILTSAHVVRDDRLSYQVGPLRYRVVERDIIGDRAILSQIQIIEKINSQIPQFQKVQK